MKLALLSDAPDGVTGLGRIHRELAQQIRLNTDWELATIGYKALGSRRFDWTQYSIAEPEPDHSWIPVFEDWAAIGERWYLVPITPPSWIFGLLHPSEMVKESKHLQPLARYLTSGGVKIAPYLAIESINSNGFGALTQSIIRRSYDVLFYNKFGAETWTGDPQYGYAHHGIYWDNYQHPDEGRLARLRKWVNPTGDKCVIGCVMTNQYRKNFGLLFEVAALLQHMEFPFRLWIHTDKDVGYWNLIQLKEDNKIKNENVLVTYSSHTVTTQHLSELYSVCDVTTLPSQGEGFGYPVIESLACGTPCVVGSWGGQAEIVQGLAPELTVDLYDTFQDGFHGLLVPVYNAFQWAVQIREVYALSKVKSNRDFYREYAKGWDWSEKWPFFQKWLKSLDR